VDLLGHRQGARPRDPAAYASLEQSIIDAISRTGQVGAVGFSLGAQLLLHAAAVHFALAPGNDRAALAACLRRPHTPLTEADSTRSGSPCSSPWAIAISPAPPTG